MIKVATLCLDDLPQVATIHLLSFPDSALSALGHEAVKRYYDWLLTGPHKILPIGIWVDGQLEGFSFGGVFRGALSGFIKKNRWYLIRRVLLHPWIVFKFRDAIDTSLNILRIRQYRKSKHLTNVNPPPQKRSLSFGVLAIAISPEQQGKGLGQMIMEKSKEFAVENNFEKMNLTVHPENAQAVGFYAKLGWEEALEDGVWKGKMIKKL